MISIYIYVYLYYIYNMCVYDPSISCGSMTMIKGYMEFPSRHGMYSADGCKNYWCRKKKNTSLKVNN